MSQGHVITFQDGTRPMSYSGTDMYNQHYNQHSDTELINLGQASNTVRVKNRPYDWLICSVFGYLWTLLCFACWPGMCAMYYAIRANHAVDFERDEELIISHTKRAKCLTLTSISIGAVLTVICVIIIIVGGNSYRHSYGYKSVFLTSDNGLS